MHSSSDILCCFGAFKAKCLGPSLRCFQVAVLMAFDLGSWCDNLIRRASPCVPEDPNPAPSSPSVPALWRAPTLPTPTAPASSGLTTSQAVPTASPSSSLTSPWWLNIEASDTASHATTWGVAEAGFSDPVYRQWVPPLAYAFNGVRQSRGAFRRKCRAAAMYNGT